MTHAESRSADLCLKTVQGGAADAPLRDDLRELSAPLLEAERNHLLRRVDWRFLLPDPHPARAVCFTPGQLARAIEQMAATVVEPAGASDCDLAVAVDPTDGVLDAALAALRPGGLYYTEWYRPSLGGLGGIRRRLENAGFADVTCYWAWPPPSKGPAAFWLPIESAAAVRYFLRGRPTPHAPAARLQTWLQRLLWRAGWRAGHLLPLCVVARKPSRPWSESSRAAAATEADLQALVRERWSEWGLGEAPRKLSWLLLTGGLRSINKPVALVFGDAAPRPSLAVKMSRVPEAAATLARESAVLTTLHTSHTQPLPGVPRIIFHRQTPDGATLAETVIGGTPVSVALRPESYGPIATRATDWLAQLAGRPVPASRATWWNRLVSPVLDRFQQTFGGVANAAFIEETRGRLATLDALPLVCEQRDFSPWNVLLGADGSLAVLDWESAELRGLPGMDLLYFLTYLAFYRDGAMASGEFRQSYAAGLDPLTPTGAVRSECLARYGRLVGVAPSALAALRPFVWLIHADSEYQRFVADHGGTPPTQTLKSSLFVALWEMECAALRQADRVHG